MKERGEAMRELKQITVASIAETATVSFPRAHTIEMKDRRTFGLSFCKEGQISYAHGICRVVEGPQTAVFLPQGASYTIYGDRGGTFYVINFTAEGKLPDTVTPIPLQDTQTFLYEYEQMRALHLSGNSRAKEMSLFYGMLHRLGSEGGAHVAMLSPAVRMMEESYGDPLLSVGMLARRCAVSEVYFRRLFLTAYGITPKQYLIELRLSKAKQLLLEGASVCRVAEACGFGGPYHFSRLFKERVGMPPSNYARRNSTDIM